ncbi:uncharacterized protein [Amphiura filiformis]|uniref:uncharacterized protein n=1 Tax=Amphiura filiformis TaxID=82378 RepID=UPI003B21D269
MKVEEEEADEDESSEKVVPSANTELDNAPLEIKVEKEDDDEEKIGENDFCEDPSEKVVPSANTELDFAPLKMEVEEEDDDDVDDKEEIGEDDFHEESSEKELPSPNAELDFAPLEIKVEKEDNDGDDDKEEIGQDDCLADVSEKVVLSQNAEFDFAPLDMAMVDEDEELHKDNFYKDLSEDKDDDDSENDCIVLDDETDKKVPVEEVDDDDKEEVNDDDKEQESDEDDDDYYPSEDEDSDDVDYEPSPKSLRKQENTSISNILKILSISIDDLICLPRATIQQLKTKCNLSSAQMAVVNKIRYLERLDMGEMAHRKAHWIVIKNLQSNLTQLQKEKHKLMEERDMMNKEMKKLADLYMQVYNKTFEGLQDLRGNPVDPTYFMLQHQPDGTVFLVPRDAQ